jgi:hypothetical protein
MRFLLLGSFLIVLLVGTTAPAMAQEATPEGGGCTVAPRTEDEILALSSTPYTEPATPHPEGTRATPATMPAGEAADEETVAAITDTVNQVAACAEAGDILRLLALYSDRYVVEHIFAREPQPIIPGHPRIEGQTLPATPGAAPVTSVVERAHVLPNDRISAIVRTGDEIDIVTFVKVGDRWVIDDIAPVSSGRGSPTPEATPGDGTSQYPPPVQAAIDAASDRLGLPANQLTVDTIQSMNWPDTSLGCPKEGEFYAQVITPGYMVVVTGDGKHVEYHTDEGSTVVFCGEK